LALHTRFTPTFHREQHASSNAQKPSRALNSIVILRALVVPALMALLLAVMIVLAAEQVKLARVGPTGDW
jgi:uncharacterized integral membrane protein